MPDRIRLCDPDHDFDTIHAIINDGSQAYRGVIPPDCWHEPYMSSAELRHEIASEVSFWGLERDGLLAGVMGIQPVADVILIRHAYVRTVAQRTGIGSRLLQHLCSLARGPVLIGTWADAAWAIRFYEKHGFRPVETVEKDRLLRTYWTVPARQRDVSVVLVSR